MTGIRRLECPIQHYAWGSRTSIAEIQGRPSPTDRPEAELWIGDHPNAPARVQRHPSASATIELRSFLADRPEWLGGGGARPPRLPFLLKILAADAPLSLQVHPSLERARNAFAAGHPAYVDDQPKPEILCALTPFRAMVGFRPFEESAQWIEALRSKIAAGSAATTVLSSYLAAPSERTLRGLIANLHGLPPRAVTELTLALRQLDLHQRDPDTPTADAVDKLLEHYPLDPLCVAPLLLQVITLSPGEAIHTEAGILHSYLGGTGVELMTTSDNVLRAGLTAKAVHLGELLDVTVFHPTPPGHSRRTRSDHDAFERFVTPSHTFELSLLEWTEPQSARQPAHPHLQILLCTRGGFRIERTDEPDEQAELRSGDALLVGADWGPFQIRGQGQLFRATVPDTANQEPPPDDSA